MEQITIITELDCIRFCLHFCSYFYVYFWKATSHFRQKGNFSELSHPSQQTTLKQRSVSADLNIVLTLIQFCFLVVCVQGLCNEHFVPSNHTAVKQR